MRPLVKTIQAVIASVLMTQAIAQSVPARETFKTLSQPNGENVVVVNQGDSVFHWYETRDGFLVIKNPQSGYYEYAVIIEEQGKLALQGSGIPATTLNTTVQADKKIALAKHADAVKIRIQKLKERQ